MYIPDGFLDTKIWITAAAASLVAIGYRIRKLNKDIEEKDLLIMGVLSALIFTAQMVNFPVAGGTSGYFIGSGIPAIAGIALSVRYRSGSKSVSDKSSLQENNDAAESLHSDELHAHKHAHGNIIHRHMHYHPPDHKRRQKIDEEKNGHQHSHAYSFEIYSYAESPIHRLDARTKTVVFIALILAIVLTPASEILRFGLFLVVIGCLYATSRVPISFGIKRSLVIMPFVVFAGALLVFMPDKPHPDAYHLGFAQYPISHGGLYLLFNALIKSWLSALVAILLYSTTPFPKFIKGLEMLRFPRVITMLLSFLYRFMWILTDEVKRMIRARDARTLGRRRKLQDMRIIGQMVGGLFIRSYERAERIHVAMSSRGYTGTINTLDTPALTLNDVAFVLILSGLLAIILIWRF